MSYETNRNILLAYLQDELKYPYNDFLGATIQYDAEELQELKGSVIYRLMKQFEEEGLIKILNDDDLEADYIQFLIRDIKKFSELKIDLPPSDQTSRKHTLSLSDTYELMLDDILLITPHFNSSTHRLIEFLLQNPNKRYEIQELKSILKLETNFDFHKFVENLKLPLGVKKHFISISKDSIQLTNPIQF